jgi:8-oxo-dGTP pyrophosphatase MutT (NUDIX family)
MRFTVTGAMILNEGRVLLGRRAPTKRICPDLWDFIGGHLKPQETPRQALERELLEEIGVRPLKTRPAGVIDFSAEAGRPTFYKLFAVRALSGPPRLANHEHTELAWFALEEAAALGALASPKYRPFLRAAAAGHSGVWGAGAVQRGF